MAKRPEDDSLANITPTSDQEIAVKRAMAIHDLASSKKGRFADPKARPSAGIIRPWYGVQSSH